MIHKNIFLALLLMCTCLSHTHKQIIQISIPKSGTYLLSKCISALTGKKSVPKEKNQKKVPQLSYTPSIDNFYTMINLPIDQFLRCHLYYSKERVDILNDEKFIKFFIYRDPRDQVVSFAFYMLKEKKIWPKASKMSFDDLLLNIITKSSVFGDTPPNVKGITQLYEAYLPWIATKDILTIRFEDLVGEDGDGIRETQVNNIKKIAVHLGIDLPSEAINSIADNLFGGTTTFRKGKIGAWKKYFKPEHINAFKEIAGTLLIDLGYEKDTNW